MNPISSLDQLVSQLKDKPSRHVVVAAGHDPNTIHAAARAASEGIAKVALVGDRSRIEKLCGEFNLDPGVFSLIDEPDEVEAGREATAMVRDGRADVLMKGMIGTDKYMRLILDKENGLLPEGNILSHLTVLEVPAYVRSHGKLLFVSDVAIIPEPDLAAKIKILSYCIDAAHSFGIESPRAVLLAATEKVNPKMRATTDADSIAKMTDRWQAMGAIVEGPLALDVALSPEACEIKGLKTAVNGAADILIFPNIESGNIFYKASTLLSGSRVAAVVVGTMAPCVLTSRADSEESKFLSIALGCRVAK